MPASGQDVDRLLVGVRLSSSLWKGLPYPAEATRSAPRRRGAARKRTFVGDPRRNVKGRISVIRESVNASAERSDALEPKQSVELSQSCPMARLCLQAPRVQ